MENTKIYSPVDGETGKRRELSKEEIIELVAEQAEIIKKQSKAIEEYTKTQATVIQACNDIKNIIEEASSRGDTPINGEVLDTKIYRAVQNSVKENIDLMSKEITAEIKKNVKKQMQENFLREYYKPKEVATILNVSKQSVYLWIRQGKIEPVRFAGGREIQISREELKNFEKKYAKKA